MRMVIYEDLPRHSLEAITTATQIGTIDDIIEHFRMLIEYGIDKADSTFVSICTLLIDL